MTDTQIEDGLVPLTIAARLAYDRLTPDEARVSTEEELSLLIPVVALALSFVATVFRRCAGEKAPQPIEPPELRLLLREGSIPDDAATNLFVRRSDLHKAITSLQICGAAFSRAHGA